jgi:hypothetical protein
LSLKASEGSERNALELEYVFDVEVVFELAPDLELDLEVDLPSDNKQSPPFRRRASYRIGSKQTEKAHLF